MREVIVTEDDETRRCDQRIAKYTHLMMQMRPKYQEYGRLKHPNELYKDFNLETGATQWTGR
jgi:hypothetical protein